MNFAVSATARIVRTSQRVYERKWIFLVFSLVIFLVLLVFLARANLLPDAPHTAKHSAAALAVTPTVTLNTSPLVSGTSTPVRDSSVSKAEFPVKIQIRSINLSVAVSNPDTTNIARLDKALLSGAVRYPRSARLGEQGNVIIFGHSSYLPFVNTRYKTFDGIQKLKRGNRIVVFSKKRAYVYAVDTVSKKNTKSAAIPLAVSGKELTLSTCDSFGTKSDRFVVTARLVDSYPIGN